MTGDEGHLKRMMRAELRERRRNMTVLECETATAALTEQLITLTRSFNAQSVAAYLPTNDEPNVRGYLAWAEREGIRVLTPISRDDGLLDWVVSTGDETEGLYGWPEPVGELLGPIAINDVDLILAPAASVDRSGMRMGWGRGYFDRTLGSMEKCPPVYAVIFDNELVDSVPSEVHDKSVNGVVTPSAIVTF